MNFNFSFGFIPTQGGVAFDGGYMNNTVRDGFDVNIFNGNPPPQACETFLEQSLRSAIPRLVAMNFLDQSFLLGLGLGLEPEDAAQHADMFYQAMRGRGLDDDAANFLLNSFEQSNQFCGDLFFGMRSFEFKPRPPMIPLSTCYIAQEVAQAAQRLQGRNLLDFGSANTIGMMSSNPANGMLMANYLYGILRMRGTADDAAMFMQSQGPDFRLISLLLMGMLCAEMHHTSGSGQFGHMYTSSFAAFPPPQVSMSWNW